MCAPEVWLVDRAIVEAVIEVEVVDQADFTQTVDKVQDMEMQTKTQARKKWYLHQKCLVKVKD